MRSELVDKILGFQKNEITEYHVYRKLAERSGDKNGPVLKKISDDELKHYEQWKEFTGKDVKPDMWRVRKYALISRLFGLTFAIKMMEMGENEAERAYSDVVKEIPEAEEIINDETMHENLLIDMIDEEKIGYVGSMVLGLNDALVELTGALAGLSFALQNTKLTGFVALITGIAAAMSMASSEYLSQKSDGSKHPGKASFYTGLAYIFTVLLLVAPYFVLESYQWALLATLLVGVFIIFFFTFFVSVVKERNFKRLFLEMLAISLGVAFASFLIGLAVRAFFGVDM